MERNYFHIAMNELSVEEMLMLKGGSAGPNDDIQKEGDDLTSPDLA